MLNRQPMSKVGLEDDHTWRFPEATTRRSWALDFRPKCSWNVCPTEALVLMLVEPDLQMARRAFGPKTRRHFEAGNEAI